MNGLIEAAVGGAAATQVVQGERTFDLVVRLQPQYPRDAGADRQHSRRDADRARRCRCASWRRSPSSTGASFIYRQDNSRYIGVQYSVEGRDLASAVQDAQRQVADAGEAARRAITSSWGGEYEEYTASRGQLRVVIPVTLALIFLLLFALYHNFKFPVITVVGVILSAPLGGVLALWLSRHAVLGVVGDRVPRAVRRVGADRGGLHLVRERAAAAGAFASPTRRAKPRCCDCGRS